MEHKACIKETLVQGRCGWIGMVGMGSSSTSAVTTEHKMSLGLRHACIKRTCIVNIARPITGKPFLAACVALMTQQSWKLGVMSCWLIVQMMAMTVDTLRIVHVVVEVGFCTIIVTEMEIILRFEF